MTSIENVDAKNEKWQSTYTFISHACRIYVIVLRKCYFLAKKGEKYKCEDCGLVVVVEDPCGCEPIELVCCGAPMKPAKEASKEKPKAKKK